MLYDLHNKSLLLLADHFKDEEYYKAFLLLREKGLKKDAFVSLDKFIQIFQQKTDAEKRDFVIRLFSLTDKNGETLYMGIPYQLWKILYPLLKNWCDNGDKDERLYFWYGDNVHDLEYVKKALVINSDFQPAKKRLIGAKIGRLQHATHHLPDYYIQDGEEHDDWNLCQELKEEIKSLSNEDIRDFYLREILSYEELIGNYIEWKTSGEKNLEEWGERNNKRVSSGVIAIYYQD